MSSIQWAYSPASACTRPGPVADINAVVRVKLLEGGLKLCRGGGQAQAASQPDSGTSPTRRSPQRGPLLIQLLGAQLSGPAGA